MLCNRANKMAQLGLIVASVIVSDLGCIVGFRKSDDVARS